MVEADSGAVDKYEVPYGYRKVFNAEQISELLTAFKNYDTDKSGAIDDKEFKNALKAMGHDEVTDTIANELMKKVDKNNDGVIEWLEFLEMMQLVKKTGNDFGKALSFGG